MKAPPAPPAANPALTSVEVLSPGTSKFKDLIDFPELNPMRRRHATIDYNVIVDAYNKTPVGSLTLFLVPERSKKHNIIAVLRARGLEPFRDYSLSRAPKYDDKGRRAYVMHRHTVVEGKMVVREQ